MGNYFTDGVPDQSVGNTNIAVAAAPVPTGGGSIAAPASDFGKFSFNWGDPVASLEKAIGGFADSTGKELGAIGEGAKLVGSIGIPGGPNLGGIPKAIGDIGIPGGPHVADIPGAAGNLLHGVVDVASAPGRFVESETAKARLRNNLPNPDLASQFLGGNELPYDIQQRLDAGESVDALAEELVKRGAGFSNDPLTNFAGEVILDPMNLIAPGAGKAFSAVRGAGIALKGLDAGEHAAVGTEILGGAYNKITGGMSQAGAAIIDHTLGPSTAGILHVVGTAPYLKLRSALPKVSADALERFTDGMAAFHAQIQVNALARSMEDDALKGLADISASPLDMARARLSHRTTEAITRDTEAYYRSVVPTFEGIAPDVIRAQTIARLAEATGISLADATRIIGKTPTLQTAQMVHGLYYGAKGHELAQIIRTLPPTKGLDIGRLTLIAPDTLTVERKAALKELFKTDPQAAFAKMDEYSVLRREFGHRNVPHADVVKFMDDLEAKGRLPNALREPKTGKNPLPTALSEFRKRNEQVGYDVGFAPKDPWAAVVDEATGRLLSVDPFIPFADDASVVAARNPLGRFVDGLFRGISQERIVVESRHRFVTAGTKAGLAPAEARSIHSSIVHAAADVKVSSRAVVGRHTAVEGLENATLMDKAFVDEIGLDRYLELRKTVDPVYLTLRAFRGNLKTVGITQWLSGTAKTIPKLGKNLTILAEDMYPQLRFKLNPLFQAQEAVESPFLNAMRGIFFRRNIEPEAAKILEDLATMPEFKLTAEAGYTLNIAGGEAARQMGGSRFGQLLGNALDIGGRKGEARLTQVFNENPADFVAALQNASPRMYAAWVEKVGSDPAKIADTFLMERRLLAQSPEDALTVFDAAKPVGPRTREAFVKEYNALAARVAKAEKTDVPFAELPQATQDAYNRGDWETFSRLRGYSDAEIAAYKRFLSFHDSLSPQELDRTITRDATGGQISDANALFDARLRASGGTEVAWNPDMESIWQVFRDTLEQSSKRAYKTHFFATERGWLERTVNHPYLGLYPASYMYGKILPEFGRFLLKRPFGLKAPLVGALALHRTQQALIAQMATDPGFAQWLTDHKEALFLINQLLPSDPTNIGASLPAYARHIAEDVSGGKEVTLKTGLREAVDTGNYSLGAPIRGTSTLLNGANDLGAIAGDLFANLTRAAAEYDGQFPRRNAIPLPRQNP